MVRIRFRDGVAKRPHYGVIGRFTSDGVSLRKWVGKHVPLLRRFFALNQHRRMFEIVDDDPCVPGVVLPELESDADGVVTDESESTADDSAAKSPVYDLLLGPLSEPVPVEAPAEEADDDADHSDERKVRRGRPKKVRS